MTAWCHIPTIFNQRHGLRIAGILTLCVALITTLFFTNASYAAPSTNRTINFQGRLLTSAGAVVADGHYNIQFKIYQGGTGAAVGNPGGSLQWTETYVNNGDTNGVMVKNGSFSVALGSVNPFGSSVDWDSDALWLSMNVAGNATACATFGTAPCGADGEMLPMKRITATPYALNAGAVGGKTADNFIQLAQGVQTDASTNTSSIHINKTGTGNLIQLQNAGQDVFTVNNAGNIELGSGANRALYVGGAAPNTAGNNLTIFAGYGGSGSGSIGGNLFLQGGGAGGDNAKGGDVSITGGAGTGTGGNGSVFIGASDTDTVQIGSINMGTSGQSIYIGNMAGPGTQNVVVGASGTAGGGSTTIQSKSDTTIATNGTTRATFDGDSNTLYLGNANGNGEATTANSFTIQGTSSTSADTQGGSLTLQAGSATNGNANGGNLTLSGGAGVGTGATGLVVINTPTFQTSASDANCYTGGALVASSCTFTSASVNSSAVLVAGFSANSQVATLPDPAITTAGRILYVTAANGSKDFTLRANTGAGLGVEQNITLRQNTTATMIWNGSDWTAAGGSNSTTLQDAYNTTAQGGGGAELTLSNAGNADGLTIRDGSTNSVDGPLLEVQNSTATQLFSVNSNVADGTEHATDGTVSNGAAFSTNWTAVGDATVSRSTTEGQAGNDSAEVAAGTTAGNGVKNKLAINPLTNTRYRISVYAKLDSGSAFTDFKVRYSANNNANFVDCTDYSGQTILTTGWTQITCYIDTDATAVTTPYVHFVQPTTAANARTFFVDTFSLTRAPNGTSSVQIGEGIDDALATLFTLDRSTSAPTGASHETLLGSMYYDTTLGKVQCYEAEGWGACGASPDSFITLSPEYSNAVMHGTDVGTMTSGLCSDALNINDGSSSQPTICGSNETYNFYEWTSAEATAKTRSVFVTYQLPTSFKAFVAGSTSLMGRTDSSNATAAYQVYRKNGTTGALAACGSSVSVSTGAQSTWQKATASGSADPSACGFAAGDSIVIRINLTASSDANAYVSNLGFTFSNN